MPMPSVKLPSLNNPEILTLANGMTVILDFIPHVQTVAMGVWCHAGSRYESPEISGISHFLEHMVFKGTQRRSALDISQEIESVGGHLNAYTGREATAYHARLLSKDCALGVDILSDITLNPTFPSEEIERERGVILQEIGQTEDTPDDIIFDHFFETAYPKTAVGRPVLGSVQTVQAMTQDQLRTYRTAHYVPEGMVFCVSGRFDAQALGTQLEATFGTLPRHPRSYPSQAAYGGGVFQQERELEQSHIILGFQGISNQDPDYQALSVLSTVLGGGMSSRLFQEIREKRGLVYSVFSFASFLKDTGLFGVYAGTGPDQVTELLDVTAQELNRFADTLDETEIDRAKNQMTAGMLMGLESTGARCEHWAMSYLTHGRVRTTAEILEQIEGVSKRQLQDLSQRIFSGPITLASLGPHNHPLTFSL